MSLDINVVRPTVHVLIPYEIVDGELRSGDYDIPEFREEVKGWFRQLGLEWAWHKVSLKNVTKTVETLKRLNAEGEIVVFNLCDGAESDGYPGVSLVNALTRARLPFTGATAEFYLNSTSKLATKKLLRSKGVPTAPFVAIEDDERDLARAAKEIGFPFIIKPDVSAGSYGIQRDSVCYDIESAKRKVAQLRNDPYVRDTGLFVEKFIQGREFTVFAVEDEDQPLGLWVLPPCERAFHKDVPADQRYLIYERYWGLPEAERVIPEGEVYYWYASAPIAMRADIEDTTRRAIRAVGGSGYARVDIRRDDATGQFCVLEVNAQCGMSGSDEATVGSMLKLGGVTISAILEKILEHGMNRWPRAVAKPQADTGSARKFRVRATRAAMAAGK